MIAKVEVRKRLDLYEEQIKQHISRIDATIKTFDGLCGSEDMQAIWRQSNTYAIMAARRDVLYDVLAAIRDIRFDDMFADEN